MWNILFYVMPHRSFNPLDSRDNFSTMMKLHRVIPETSAYFPILNLKLRSLTWGKGAKGPRVDNESIMNLGIPEISKIASRGRAQSTASSSRYSQRRYFPYFLFFCIILLIVSRSLNRYKLFRIISSASCINFSKFQQFVVIIRIHFH